MTEPGAHSRLHHAVIAVAPDRVGRTVRLFTDLGFDFAEFDLEDVGLRVWLDWARGIEMVTPVTDDPGNRVRQFLETHGDGVFSIAVRVDAASAAAEVAARYGAVTNFSQHRDGDGWQLDEIEMRVLGLPITLLSTDIP